MQARQAVLLLALCAGCGGRPATWDARFDANPSGDYSAAYGLSGSLAVVDAGLDRITMLTAPLPLQVIARQIPVGKNLALVAPSQDGKTLFALSRGVQPRRYASDQRPELTVIDGGLVPFVRQIYPLNDPLDRLAVDPENEWVVLYQGASLVSNPNELLLVHLADPASAVNPVSKTLRSFGGKPERLTFSSTLALPGGRRRLLVVESASEVSLVDLGNPESDELTVPLPATETGGPGHAEQVVVHDAETGSGPRVAVRLTGSASVLILELVAASDPSKSFSVVTNLVDVGGIPASIDFVRTSQGLRLLALVGTRAVLVDPSTTNALEVAMPAAYTRVKRITEAVVGPSDADVALLYGPSLQSIAYFTLGSQPGTLYRSIEQQQIGISVQDVIDVPGVAFADRKILESPSVDFYVLNLTKRESSPMDTLSGLELSVSPDGGRVWAHERGGFGVARLTLGDLHPVSLSAERRVFGVYDIAAADGGRSALLLHLPTTASEGGVALTALDALAPDGANTRFYSGLELGGLP